MERINGTPKTPKVEKVDGKYLVRWDYQGNSKKVTFYEIEFPYKPSLETVKNVILKMENSKIDEKILSGFSWNGMNVWLSSENQFNYKAAYDIAVQTEGANLPITFKFGSTENPEYHSFETLQDLTDFYMKAMNYINQTLLNGWTSKDSIDWTEYEEALKDE